MQKKCLKGDVKMQEIGIVESVEGKEAIVNVKRSTACGDSCATCGAQCKTSRTKISAKNLVDAKVGDKVQIEMATRTVILSAILVYILPLVVLFGAYFLAELYYGLSEKNSVICGLIAFSASFVLLFIADKFTKKRFIVNITDIIDEERED